MCLDLSLAHTKDPSALLNKGCLALSPKFPTAALQRSKSSASVHGGGGAHLDTWNFCLPYTLRITIILIRC